MTHIAPLVTVIITSSLLRWTAAEASTLCTWTKVLPNEEVHYSFLRSDPRQTSPSLRLYHSAWSGERTLLSCAWSDDAAVIQNYVSLCRERTQEFSDHPDVNFHVDSLFEAEELCVYLASPGVGVRGERTGKRPVRSVDGHTEAGSPPANRQGQSERSEVRTHHRVKRGFIVPGTLWCGSGNKAPSYADLGVFAETDSCCREHDHCKHTILSFHSEFGVFNRNIFTMSHCDCDNKFRSCLMEANDSISDVVGYTFFNLLKMHCFEFSHRLQCTQRNWFGMCKETQMAVYAEVHVPTQYESSSPTEVSTNSTSSVINSTIPTELLQSSTSDPQLFSITSAASTVPTPSTSSTSPSITPVTNVATSTVPSTSEGPTGSVPESKDDLETTLPTKNQNNLETTLPTKKQNDLENTLPTKNQNNLETTLPTKNQNNLETTLPTKKQNDLENTLPTKNQTLPDLEADITEKQLSCAIYKDLDECRNKILPQQKRYGLHNPEATTLYHCNCTTRLFQTLARQRQMTEVQAFLLGHVSQSCFLPQDCTAGKICAAILVKTEFPQLDQSSSADMEEQRHLQAVKLKVRRPNTRRAKRKDRAVRLHKLCLRMVRPKLNKTRKHGQDAHRPAVRRRQLV